jgi:hypothetical protein
MVVMPKNCEGCPLRALVYHNGDFDNACNHPDGENAVVSLESIPETCPLREGALVIEVDIVPA